MNLDIAVMIGQFFAAFIFLIFVYLIDEEHKVLKVIFSFFALFIAVNMLGLTVQWNQVYGAAYNSTIINSTWVASSYDTEIDNTLARGFNVGFWGVIIALFYVLYYLIIKWFKRAYDDGEEYADDKDSPRPL